MGNPSCESEEMATKVVNEVWESCFKDTRPFDEVNPLNLGSRARLTNRSIKYHGAFIRYWHRIHRDTHAYPCSIGSIN